MFKSALEDGNKKKSKVSTIVQEDDAMLNKAKENEKVDQPCGAWVVFSCDNIHHNQSSLQHSQPFTGTQRAV